MFLTEEEKRKEENENGKSKTKLGRPCNDRRE